MYYMAIIQARSDDLHNLQLNLIFVPLSFWPLRIVQMSFKTLAVTQSSF